MWPEFLLHLAVFPSWGHELSPHFTGDEIFTLFGGFSLDVVIFREKGEKEHLSSVIVPRKST
jgi:hypothetical protein